MAETNPDLLIIGGGIAGASFATVMARAGHSVLMIEITPEHRDVVRGEWIAPWGVAEVKRLGLYDLYRSHGAHHIARHISYDEDLSPAEAEARTLRFAMMTPDEPLTIGHPRLCTLLDEAAVAAGARFLRGVRKVQVTPGASPIVHFEHEGAAHEIRPRLVIAADGRHGRTASQVGIKLHADAPHHLFAGLLIEGAHDWPDDLEMIGNEGDLNFFAFPQGQGRIRLYQGVALDQKARFVGEDANQRFVDTFALACVPGSDALANAKPASQCFFYPNNDTWSDEPFVAGVVAIGDAAGHNDPTIGQGLSIAHRDVRIVSEILKATSDWSPTSLRPYAEERRERMRRLRLAGRYAAARDCEFGDAARARRGRLRGMFMKDPVITALSGAPIAGPDVMPAEAFNETALDALLK